MMTLPPNIGEQLKAYVEKKERPKLNIKLSEKSIDKRILNDAENPNTPFLNEFQLSLETKNTDRRRSTKNLQLQTRATDGSPERMSVTQKKRLSKISKKSIKIPD